MPISIRLISSIRLSPPPPYETIAPEAVTGILAGTGGADILCSRIPGNATGAWFSKSIVLALPSERGAKSPPGDAGASPLAPLIITGMAELRWTAFFCNRLRPDVGGGREGSDEMYEAGGRDETGRSRMRRALRPEGGGGCGPEGVGREVVLEVGFLGSGSGAHDSIGRWSEGSTSRPSCVMIMPLISS